VFVVPLLVPCAYTYTLYPPLLPGNPLTFTVVVSICPLSKYPFIIRTFPAASVIGESHTSSAFHVTVAVVAVPVLSTKESGELLTAPVASFQLLSGTTPACSALPIDVPNPTKSMLIALLDPPEPPPDAVTLSGTVAVCVSVPLVPVIVSVTLPAGVLDVVVTVSVVFPGALTVLGLNVPTAPVGNPLTVKLTVPLNPFTAPALTVYVALPPALTVEVTAVPVNVKSGFGDANGTICIPFTGARSNPFDAVLGIADSWNPVTFGIVNTM
jgi:hypothetical protein